MKYSNQFIAKSMRNDDQLPNRLMSLLVKLMWLIFAACVGLTAFSIIDSSRFTFEGYIHFDGLALTMLMAISFFSAIVHSYAQRYMSGYKRYHNFMISGFVFTLAVMLLVVADHVVLFALSWLVMGAVMAALIGHVRDWQDARAAGKYAFRQFLLGTISLSAGIAVTSYYTGEVSIAGIAQNVEQIPVAISVIAVLLIIVAALVQSSLFPFHKWLLSSLTAPTPASALMHAGFVNAAGILLTRFAPLFYSTKLLGMIVIIGVCGAILGKFWKQIQVTVKRKLACSTIAQMGFMLVQCGLGFFSAAITHLILHGFYKAYLFLSSGSEIIQQKPEMEKERFNPAQLPVLILSGLIGGLVFILITGKGMIIDSGGILTLVVVISVIHATHTALRSKQASHRLKFILTPLLIIISIVVYAMIFNGVTYLMEDVKMSNAPVKLDFTHALAGFMFLMSYIMMSQSWLKQNKQLYTFLLNASQPFKRSTLIFKK